MINLLLILLATLKPTRGILSIDKLNFYVKDNAKDHQTIRYELVHRQPETLIIRRGSKFSFAIRFLYGGQFDSTKDQLKLYFNFGNFLYKFHPLVQ
jgi:hypothetical protein